MKAYYFTIIGIIILIVSVILQTKGTCFNIFDTYFIMESTLLLQVLAAVFLLVAFIMKLVNIKRII